MRILRKSEVIERVGFTGMHISRLEKAGLFPKRFQLVDGGHAVGWLESEVNEWIEQRAASRVSIPIDGVDPEVPVSAPPPRKRRDRPVSQER